MKQKIIDALIRIDQSDITLIVAKILAVGFVVSWLYFIITK